MSSKTIDAIFNAAIDRLRDHERNISDKEAGEVASILQGSKYERDIEDTVRDLYDVNEDNLRDMSDREFDKETRRLGTMVADSFMHLALRNAGILKYISEDEERDLDRANRALERELSGGSSRRGRRDRDDNDRGSRRRGGRDRDDERGGRRRRGNDRNRNASTERTTRHERDEPEDNGRRNSRDEDSRPPEPQVTQPTKLEDRTVITKADIFRLPMSQRDLPMYYAGLEKLVYNAEQERVEVVVFAENIQVDYELHRTDLYLGPNRGYRNVAKTAEELEKQLAKAAETRVRAFIEDEGAEQTVTENTVENRRPINTPICIDGQYAIDAPIVGGEQIIREQLAEIYGDKVNNTVYTVNIQHSIGEIKPRVEGANDEVVTNFINKTANLGQLVNLSVLREWLLAAQDVLTSYQYDHLHKMVNDVVCNALTATKKAGITTPSWLVDYDPIVKLVSAETDKESNFPMLLMNNLTMMLPNISVGDGTLIATRSYIFLPFSKNDIVFATPGAYGVISNNERPQLFNLLKSIKEANTVEGIRPWYTIVTNEDASLNVRPAQTAIEEIFYVFKPF